MGLADGAAWLLLLQYTRSKYQKSGIAQSAYVAQGFSPVTFTTGTDAQWRRLRKRGDDRIDSLHGNPGHMTTLPSYRDISDITAICPQEVLFLIKATAGTSFQIASK